MIQLNDVGVRCGRTARRDRNFNRLFKRTLGRMRDVLARNPAEQNEPVAEAKEFWAIRHISLRIGQGESVGIIGTNGAGKSTLLRVIGGIYRPTHGEVSVDGNITPLLALQHGFNPELTGIENLRMAGILLGLDSKRVEELVPDILEFTELEDFIEQPVRTYSSGMAARLGFAISTAVVPDVLILDEIMSVGDGAFRERCKERLQSLIAEARIMLLCSHSMSYVAEQCDRVIWLNRGHIVMDDETGVVLDRYQEFLAGGANRTALRRLKLAG